MNMVNFDYCSPTRLIFGKGVVDRLPEVIRPIGNKILLTYGGGSIKRSGLYDKVTDLLKGFEVTELSRIAPNPKYNPSVLDGVRLCKENGIDVILAVGGGSVLDCSKAIAAGAKYDGEPWDLISYKVKAQAALPIVDIMTMAATGSEYDCGGVISRTETNDKIGYLDSHLWPVCSLLDPTYTFTVPARQTVAGVADAINHIMEQYFSSPANDLSDGFCEAGLKTLMKNVRTVLEKPEDVEREKLWLAFGEGLAEKVARAEPQPVPFILHNSDLLVNYDINDHHMGMLAWGLETLGENYDLKIAEKLLDVTVFNRLRRGAWWQAPIFATLAGSVLDTMVFFSVAFSYTSACSSSFATRS